ncbi:MAG: hypothetical protein ABFD25_00690 [Clostridiaceae bacterium]
MAKIKSVTTCAGDGVGLSDTLLDIHFIMGRVYYFLLNPGRTTPHFSCCTEMESCSARKRTATPSTGVTDRS